MHDYERRESRREALFALGTIAATLVLGLFATAMSPA